MPEVITDNLDLWTSGLLTKSTAGRGSNGKLEAYGIKKLRELILELAVRGKMVLQDSSDEPARELLKRVAADKAKMVKEGRIRKEKDFLAIAGDEIPFNVPGGWEWVRINDVGHDWGQKTPDAKFTYIDVSAIDNNSGVISSPSLLSAADAPSRARKIVRKGTVIYSTVRPYLKNICVIEEDYSPEAIASTAFAVLHPFQGMPGKFFALYFRSPEFVKYVEKVQTGIAYPAINDKQFYGGLVPIPPLAEQHRIVAKVDALMALCDQLEQEQTDSLATHQTLVDTLLGTLTRVESQQEFSAAWARIASHFDTLFTTEASIDQLKQTILQLAVMGKLVPQDPNDEPTIGLQTDISRKKEAMLADRKVKYRDVTENSDIAALKYEIPEKWEWMRFGDVVFFQEGPGIRNWQFTSEGIKLLNVSNILPNCELDFSNSDKYVSMEEFCEKYAHFQIKEGDLLFAGSGGSWGKVAWYKDPGYPVMLNTSTMRLRFFDFNFAPNYLFGFTKSEFFRRQVSHQLVGLQPNFGSTHLSRIYIPIPPLNEQHRIVAKVDELMALCYALKARLADAQATQLHLADAIVEQAVC